MRGFTAGGTTKYRTDTTRSRDGEEMEGGFRCANMAVLRKRETQPGEGGMWKRLCAVPAQRGSSAQP